MSKPIVAEKPSAPAPRPRADEDPQIYVRRHLRFGWWSLLVFLTLGIVLEGLHAFKVGAYLNVSNSTRRLLWTLAHAHGTALGVVHVAFAFTANYLTNWSTRARAFASGSLMASSILLPGGFFLGGLVIYSGDPGLGILLVPLGAVFLLIAVLLCARAAQVAVFTERRK
jgi:hypothetical protein